MKEDIEDFNPIKEEIANHPETYPFIAHFWKFHIESPNKKDDAKPIYSNYGQFTTVSYLSNPFYKYISKLFDFNKIENEL